MSLNPNQYQVINPDLIDWSERTGNLMSQLTQRLEFCVDVGRIALDDARYIFSEWFLDTHLDTTMACAAEQILMEASDD